MKINSYIYYLLLFSGCLGVLSCEEDKMPYLQLKDTNVSFDLNTSRFDPTVQENAAKLKVPVVLAGIPGTFPVSVTVKTDTVGHKNPAIEGVDYFIKEKTVNFQQGYGTQYIEIVPVNNEERQPNRTFDLVIASTTPELKPNPSNRITITILDGGHPLLYMKGAYQVTGHDIVWTGNVVHFMVTITPDPENDHAVYVENFPLAIVPLNGSFKMTVDAEGGLCHIPPQIISNISHEGVTGNVGLYYTFTFIDEEDGNEYLDYDPDKKITLNYLNEGKKLQATSEIGAFGISGSLNNQIFFVFRDLVMEKADASASAATPQPFSVSFPGTGLRIPFKRE